MPYITAKLRKKCKATEYFLQLGVTYAKLQAKCNFIDDQVAGAPPPALVIQNSKTFYSKKLIPIAKIGVRHNITDKFGIKLVRISLLLSNFQL